MPYAVRRLERDPRRRSLMTAIVTLGGLVAAALVSAVLRGPISAVAAANHVAYSVPMAFDGFIAVSYMVATCGALLLSSDKVVVVYGIVNLVIVAVLAVLLTSGIISLWCLLAAATSIAIAVHLRQVHWRQENAAVALHAG